MTLGLDVLVQLVMAAITTSPWCSDQSASLGSKAISFSLDLSAALMQLRVASFSPDIDTRSCGRLGPARLGSTVPRSSDKESVKRGSGVLASRHMPCAWQ